MFAQTDNDNWKADIDCCKCGEKGHLAWECTKKKTKEAVSDALDNSFAAVATYNDSGNTGGEGGLVDLSAVETVAAAVRGGEVLSINSASDDSRLK